MRNPATLCAGFLILVLAALAVVLLHHFHHPLKENEPELFHSGKPRYVGEHGLMRLELLAGTTDEAARTHDLTLEHGEQGVLGPAVYYKGCVYTDLDRPSIRGSDPSGLPTLLIRPLAELPGLISVTWVKLEAEHHHYENSDDIPGWWGPVNYLELVWEPESLASDSPGAFHLDWLNLQAWNGTSDQAEDPAPEPSPGPGVALVDVSPLKQRGLVWNGVNVGVMRYAVILEFEDHVLSSPGAEALAKAGTLPGVRLVRRMGDTGNPIVDQGLSLANLPYIWGSACLKGERVQASHQAELMVGSDCADLVVAAWRLAGATTEKYSSVIKLVTAHGFSKRSIVPSGTKKGVYLDPQGQEIVLGPGGVEIGAAVLWVYKKTKGHAALLIQDKGPDGKANHLLDRYDLVLHTSFAAPEVEPLGQVIPGLLPAMFVNPPKIKD